MLSAAITPDRNSSGSGVIGGYNTGSEFISQVGVIGGYNTGSEFVIGVIGGYNNGSEFVGSAAITPDRTSQIRCYRRL